MKFKTLLLAALALGITIPAQAQTAATSMPQTGTATSSAVTPTTGTATFSSGVTKIGPLVPTRGFAVRLLLTGTWTGTAYAGTTADDCATVNQLTAGGTAVAYSGNVNEIVDAPSTTRGNIYCAVVTVASGTVTYGLFQ